MTLTLSVIEGSYSVCRLDPNAPLPPWATSGTWWSITKTHDELSIVCESRAALADNCERGWSLIKVQGPLDFALTGVLSKLSSCLADGGVSLLAVSTFDTDYLLTKTSDLERARALLTHAGCDFRA